MKNNSFKLAYSGIIVAISIVSMFLAGVFPFAEYTFPAISGIVLIPIVIHFGYKTSLTGYAAVALLSLILSPNKESAVLFCMFLGYYPILKAVYERVSNIVLSWGLKVVTFNIAVIFAYVVLINIFEMTQLLEDFNFVKYGILAVLFLGNIVFVIYDMALTKVISMYVHVIIPKYVSRFIK